MKPHGRGDYAEREARKVGNQGSNDEQQGEDDGGPIHDSRPNGSEQRLDGRPSDGEAATSPMEPWIYIPGTPWQASGASGHRKFCPYPNCERTLCACWGNAWHW